MTDQSHKLLLEKIEKEEMLEKYNPLIDTEEQKQIHNIVSQIYTINPHIVNGVLKGVSFFPKIQKS